MSLIINTDKPIALGSDHAGYEAKQHIIGLLRDNGIPFRDYGTYSLNSTDYPDYAHPMATAVESGECYPGIAICASGNGINMTVNKHQGIRAALCWTPEIAYYARSHNDANILSLPGRMLPKEEILQIVITFLTTPFEGGRHVRRIKKIPCG